MMSVNLKGSDVYHTLTLYTISGGFSDSDLIDVSKDDSYKPDKGKGNEPKPNLCCYYRMSSDSVTISLLVGGHPRGDNDPINQYDDNNGEHVLGVLVVRRCSCLT